MAKRSDKEYFLALTVLAVLIILLVGFYFAWSSKQHRAPVAYAKFDSMVVTNQAYSIKTDIAIQVASENELWLKKNKTSLENILRNSLADTDAQIATAPNGLKTLQDSLKEASNNGLKTNKIQNVFFTDFVLVPAGSE